MLDLDPRDKDKIQGHQLMYNVSFPIVAKYDPEGQGQVQGY